MMRNSRENSASEKTSTKNPCTKIPYTKIRYKNHLREIHLHKHSVCSPALEILNEVHQSIPLRMWSYTKNLGWSSSVDPTPYVVLHEESWVKFISPMQWINPLEDFFLSSGTLDMTSSAFIALLQKQTSFRKSCNKYTIKSPNLLTGSRFHFWLAR
jgi:hypothetical protein